MTVADIISQTQHKMGRTIETLREDFTKIRTGRASTGLLEHIMVDYYGCPTPLTQVAQLGVGDARTLTVQPWEKNMVAVVEKAIRNSDLGLNPATSGMVIRVPLPPLTEERRRELGLHERFAARERHPAAALLVEGLVLHADAQHLLRGFPRPLTGERPRRGLTHAGPAPHAGRGVDPHPFGAERGRPPRAGARASAAAQALPAVPQNLHVGALAFRVGAPRAAQRAALQEHDGADARPVVQAELLEIENQALLAHGNAPLVCLAPL